MVYTDSVTSSESHKSRVRLNRPIRCTITELGLGLFKFMFKTSPINGECEITTPLSSSVFNKTQGTCTPVGVGQKTGVRVRSPLLLDKPSTIVFSVGLNT